MWFDSYYFYVVVILVILAFLAYTYQGRLVYLNYMPEGANQYYTFVPSQFEVNYEDLWVKTEDDIEINCWLIFEGNKPNPKAPTLVFFHGNAGNMGFRMEMIQPYIKHLNCNVFIVSYRGYGKSHGSPSEKGLRLDARAVWKYIKSRQDLDQSQLFILGRSLGGAVTLHLAIEIKDAESICGIIIENTFTSIVDMIDHTMPIFKYFKMFVTEKWLNLKQMPKISKDIPILFNSNEKDEVVPPYMMKTLYEKCKSTLKKMEIFENVTHNETYKCDKYLIVMKEFIKQCVSRQITA